MNAAGNPLIEEEQSIRASIDEPILVALALDNESNDVVEAARELALRMRRPLLFVHAVRPWLGEMGDHVERRIHEAREKILDFASSLDEAGVRLCEPIAAAEAAPDLVIATAREARAHMIVTGGGSPPTVRRWLFGSTAEAIVRTAPLPVFVARGTLPGPNRAVLCPVSDSHEARVGLNAALRMARLFEARLHVLRVIEPEERGWLDGAALDRELARKLGNAREDLETFLAATDLAPVCVDVGVVVGKPAQRIVEASESAALLVLGSRGFEGLVPGSLPDVAEAALRFSRISALCLNDRDPVDAAREATLRTVAQLKRTAEKHLAQGECAKALPLLQDAAGKAPADAAIQEGLAAALHGVGRDEEAGARLGLARIIRGSFQ